MNVLHRTVGSRQRSSLPRALAVAACALSLGWGGTAHAQAVNNIEPFFGTDAGINIHHTYVPMDGHGFWTVDSGTTLLKNQISFTMGLSHAYRPVEVGLAGNHRIARTRRSVHRARAVAQLRQSSKT